MARYATTEPQIECPCGARPRLDECLSETFKNSGPPAQPELDNWETRFNCPGCMTLLVIDHMERKAIDPHSSVALQDRGRHVKWKINPLKDQSWRGRGGSTDDFYRSRGEITVDPIS